MSGTYQGKEKKKKEEKRTMPGEARDDKVPKMSFI